MYKVDCLDKIYDKKLVMRKSEEIEYGLENRVEDNLRVSVSP